MSLTGRAYFDKNGNFTYNAGTDEPFAGVEVRLSEVTYYNGHTDTVTTDAAGHYSFDTTNLDPHANTVYAIYVEVDEDYYLFANPATFTYVSGDVVDFPFQSICTRPASTWVHKICYNPNVGGVKVTFKDRGRLFTCVYPNTTQDDYDSLVAAASKGRWIHWFYDKIKTYVPWATSP